MQFWINTLRTAGSTLVPTPVVTIALKLLSESTQPSTQAGMAQRYKPVLPGLQAGPGQSHRSLPSAGQILTVSDQRSFHI